MKKSTKILLASGALLATGAVAVNAVAEGFGPCGHHRASMGPGMGGRSPERMLERISKHLELTDEQQTEIKSAFGKNAGQMTDLRRQMTENRAALFSLDPRSPDFLDQNAGLATKQANLMEQMMQLRANRQVEVAAVLTDSQFTQWQEIRQKFGKHGRKFGGQRGPDAKAPNIIDES